VSPLGQLALVWFRVGVFGFGGGPAFVPLVREECVARQGWLTDEQFLDALAFGNALPGPIALKLAAHVGTRVAGWPGALVALFMVTAPGVLLFLGLLAVYARMRNQPAMEGAMRAVRPAVVGLLAYTAWSLVPDGIRGAGSLVIAGGAFVLLAMQVHPALVMLGALGFGALAMR
jgi:chromate transporter